MTNQSYMSDISLSTHQIEDNNVSISPCTRQLSKGLLWVRGIA